MNEREQIWGCKIGGVIPELANGSDRPLRMAVRKAYIELTGRDDEFCFSGWGAILGENERFVVESNRLYCQPENIKAEIADLKERLSRIQSLCKHEWVREIFHPAKIQRVCKVCGVIA